MITPSYQRPYGDILASRLREPRRFIQVVAGARQVGKTTLVTQVLARAERDALMVSADEPTLSDTAWLAAQWERARLNASMAGERGAVLAVDEVQKITGWSETVKRLWDEDARLGIDLQVVLLGSAPLPVQRGLTESLAGRFEIIHLPHWSCSEMRDAFGFDLDDYLFFGGYPGAAILKDDPERWRRYLLDSLIETTIARDLLLLTRIDKPALLRRLFELSCRYSGQILSYTKMLGQLQDAGNTTTLAHYLDLLDGAGMVTGLSKYAGQLVRRRGSSPKLQVLNTALMTATAGRTQEAFLGDPEFRGRLIESAVGAHLINGARQAGFEVHYWREKGQEVDFVLSKGEALTAIEVKSARTPAAHSGLAAFVMAFGPARTLIVGAGGIPLEDFLGAGADTWLD
ncbi:MAG: ATP-binding protein [bacterium]